MQRVDCYLCGHEGRIELFAQRGEDRYLSLVDPELNKLTRSWFACERCGFIYRSPVLDRAETALLYHRYEKPVTSMSNPDAYFDRITGLPPAESENQQKAAWLHAALEAARGSRIDDATAKTILDVGCGGGFLLHTLGHVLGSIALFGVEPNPAYADLARRRVAVDIREQEYCCGLFNRFFDLVVLTKVLEHVPDPRNFLAAVAEDVADGGHIFLEVPDRIDMMSLPADDERFAIHHIYYFSMYSLGVLLAEAGMAIVASRAVVTRRNRGYLQILAAPGGGSNVAPPPHDPPAAFAAQVRRRQPKSGAA